jgi:uncharacterized repeat protein (TIGR02543 family)
VDKYACILKVPDGSVSAYKSADVWKDFKNIMVEPHLVNVSVNNDKYGMVTGSGTYDINTTATVKATAKSGYIFVNWTKDGVEVSTETPYIFTVTEDVELVANFEEKTGIVETDNYPSLRVYPNPTSGQLIIEMSDMRYETCDITIYDIYGRQYQVSNLKSQISNHQIDISHLASGIYYIRIQTENGTVTRKVVKK